MAIPSGQANHSDVTAPSNVETAVASTESSEEGLLNQDITRESDSLPVVSRAVARETEKSGEGRELDRIQESADVDETALGSPFLSPKLIADDSNRVISPEEGENLDEHLNNAVVTSPVLAQGQEEQSNEKAELKLAPPIIKKESLVASTSEVQAETVETDIETEDSDSKTDTRVTIKAPKPSMPVQSLPRHMRPDFQLPPSRQLGLQDSRNRMASNEVSQFNEGPRSPRSHYTSYPSRGDHMDRERFTRMSAQLMKTKHELDTERNKNRQLQTTIEAEQQQKVEAASSSMLTYLLREQAEALTLKSKAEARERELDLREQVISLHEVYLSEGQKQLWFSLEENGVRPMSAVQMENARREAELNAQKAIADVTGKLNIKIEGLRLREAAQQMREQQYKIMVRESLQAEFAENSLTSEKADGIAEVEYNNGFGAGKEAGRKEAYEKSRKIGFLEGYGACHRAQVSLFNMRAGRIPHDSPELNFLFDPSHPHNLHNIGTQIGELEAEMEKTRKEQKKDVEDKKPRVNGCMINYEEQKRVMGTRNHGVPDEAPRTDGRVNGDTNGIVVHERDESVRKMIPARPTFAAELRGPSATHDGYIVLANNAASPGARETERPIIKYENDIVNLIDFM